MRTFPQDLRYGQAEHGGWMMFEGEGSEHRIV